MLHAGGVCCRMLRPLVQSPDTHCRVVATLVCLQHFGSHSRFAHAHLIFGGAYHWSSYCFLHRRRSSPRHPQRRAMASSAGDRAQRRQASSVDNASSDAAPTALVELPTFNTAQQFFVFRPSTSRTPINARSATPFTSHRRGMPSRRRPGQRPSPLGSSSSCCWS